MDDIRALIAAILFEKPTLIEFSFKIRSLPQLPIRFDASNVHTNNENLRKKASILDGIKLLEDIGVSALEGCRDAIHNTHLQLL